MSSNPTIPNEPNPFIGAWQLVSGEWVDEKHATITRETAQVESLKILSATKFSFITTAKDAFYAAGGGDYVVENGTYTEIPQYASYADMLGKRYTFQYEMDGDHWTNTRYQDGVLVEREVWARAS